MAAPQTSLRDLDIISSDSYARNGYPHEAWARLRREDPVHWVDHDIKVPFWAITKHEDIIHISRQPGQNLNAPRLAVFQDFAPSPIHMRHVLLPILARMGLRASLEVARPGYVPTGEGELLLRVAPVERALAALELVDPGRVEAVEGIALSSHLAKRCLIECSLHTPMSTCSSTQQPSV